jgi:hypothetical protein
LDAEAVVDRMMGEIAKLSGLSTSSA